jgi:hypothetical protein
MNILSDSISVRFDDSSGFLKIDTIVNGIKNNIVSISKETRQTMSFEEFATFLGERIILLSPSLRKEFQEYLWSSDGSPPKRK